MKLQILIVVALASLSFATSASADESGSFVVKLGQDTVSLEQFTRTPTSLDVEQIRRAHV